MWSKLLLAILFRPLGFIAPKTLINLAFQFFECGSTWWRLFLKHVLHTKFDVYVSFTKIYIISNLMKMLAVDWSMTRENKTHEVIFYLSNGGHFHVNTGNPVNTYYAIDITSIYLRQQKASLQNKNGHCNIYMYQYVNSLLHQLLPDYYYYYYYFISVNRNRWKELCKLPPHIWNYCVWFSSFKCKLNIVIKIYLFYQYMTLAVLV